MSDPDLFLDAIREKPVWRLTSEDLDALPETERQWAIRHVGFMRDEGILALVLANPDGTKYETVWDQGRWTLKPLSGQLTFDDLRSMFRQELDTAFKSIAEETKRALGDYQQTATVPK